MENILLVIIGAGLFGGTVNFFRLHSSEYKGWINYAKCVVVGLGASFLVPLFLRTISSNLVESSKTNDNDLLVLLGFCLIASIFSRRFIETIGEKILKQVEDAKQKAQLAKEIAETSKEEVDLLASKSTEVDETEKISSENISSTTTTTTKAPEVNGNKPTQDQAINILKALKDPLYTFRTLKGIIKNSGCTEEITLAVLNAMKKKDWVKEITKDGKTLFALTETGNKLTVLREE